MAVFHRNEEPRGSLRFHLARSLGPILVFGSVCAACGLDSNVNDEEADGSGAASQFSYDQLDDLQLHPVGPFQVISSGSSDDDAEHDNTWSGEPTIIDHRASRSNSGSGSDSDGASDDGASDDGAGDNHGPRSSSTPEPSDDPIPFLSIDERLALIKADLDQIANPNDRERVRYVDFSNLSNGGLSGLQIEPYRKAASLLINSLSRGEAVIQPRSIDEYDRLYAIDLRDYEWSDDTWERIIDEYPYAVSYDENSRLLPYDEETASLIRENTATSIPYVQADWLLANASRAPLYYDILELPRNLDDLADDLGIDIGRDIDDQQVARAGFNRSEVALNNRVVERHEQPGSGGALWLTYDFASSVGDRNIFAHPLDFQPDATEGIFTLPNGLHAFVIADSNFALLNKARADIVIDPYSRDRTVEAAASCLGSCHLGKGIALKNDEVRAYVVLAASDARTIDDTLALYAPVADLAGLADGDNARYLSALVATGFDPADDGVVNELVRKHQDALDITAVAAVLGIKEAKLAAALSASPQVFPPEALTLRDQGAVIYRETLDAIMPDLVEAIGLGFQISP
jgi:hypothetical protein